MINNNSSAIVPYIGSGQVTRTVPQVKELKENLMARIQIVVKNFVLDSSFKTQLRDYKNFKQCGLGGDIVILIGTSTAGKTSIIKALKELEPNRLEDGGDLRNQTRPAIFLKILKKYSPVDIEILSNLIEDPLDGNIADAINDKATCGVVAERLWKKGISNEEKMKGDEAIKRILVRIDSRTDEEKINQINAFENIIPEMFDDAFEHSRRGENIILDVLNIDLLAQQVLNRNFNGPLRAILTFCPFALLSSRMEERNKEALEKEDGNDRIGVFPLEQFSELYTQKEEGQTTLEKLEREDVTKVFEKNYAEGVTAKLLKSEDKDEALAVFLKNLGFKEGVDEVEIAPRNQEFYHAIVDTRESTVEIAKKISKGTS